MLYKLRDEKHLSKTQLAENLGTTRQLIAAYESGNTLPNIAFLAAVADYFGVSADFLLGREECGKGKKNISLPECLSEGDYLLIKEFVDKLCERLRE